MGSNGDDVRCSGGVGKDQHHHHHGGFAMGRSAPAKGGAIDVPGELTTPPLTPPREHPQMMVTSEAVNGNRNNVSDSAHASSAHFKSTKPVGVASNDAVTRQQFDEGSPEEDGHSVHVLTRMEAKPPALVVISDNANSKQAEGEREREREEEGGRGGREEVTPTGNRDHREEHPDAYRVTREVGSDQNAYISSGNIAENGCCDASSLQSTTVTSASNGGGGGGADDDAMNSDEDVEGMDLVLVEEGEEEEEEEGRGREEQQRNRTIHTTSAHTNVKTVGLEEVHAHGDPHVSRRGSPSTRGSDAGSQKGHHHHHNHHHHRPASINGREERPRNGHTSTSSTSAQGKKYISAESPSQGGNDGFHMRNKGEGNGGRVVAMTNAKQAAKVKQFFTTIQQHGNKLGSEVAEQVQELIHALMVSS